ncbi:MAG: response regulator [Acidobacteria bacterium]|nr:response regulator [Acidobacteriota bacterium]
MRSRVLVSEQDVATLNLIREVFTLHGISIRVLQDPGELDGLVEGEKFDAVFMDLATPQLNGSEFIRRIRQSSWNRSTPIVLLPQRVETRARLEAFSAGGTFFLEKPLDRTKLTRLLRSTRATMVEERRRYMRVPLHTDVECRANEREIRGAAVNVSRDGILFHGDGTLKRGQLVKLAFAIEPRKPALHATGVVARVDEKRRLGVRFVPNFPEDANMIQDFIAKQLEVL